MTALSKACVCSNLFAGNVVRIPPEHRCVALVSVVCFQVEISSSGRTLLQRSVTKCGVYLSMIVKPE